MMNMTNVLDGFVRKLKSSGEFSDARFIFGGRGEYAEKPVEGFLVACSVGKEEYIREQKGETVKANLEFCLYAPQGEGKRALTLLSQKLAYALRIADEEQVLGKITVADSGYDSNMTVWKQNVTAMYVFTKNNVEPEKPDTDPDEPEDTEPEVYYERILLEGAEIPFVTHFEVRQECTAYELKEFLCGGVEEYICPDEKYSITMTVQGEGLFPEPYVNKSLCLYREVTDVTYDGCRITKIVSKRDANLNSRQEITLTCSRAHKGAEL